MKSSSYDLALFLDVIEHFEKEEGFSVLKELRRISKKVLITTPKDFYEQVVEENPLENHRSYWTADDFVSFGKVEFFEHPDSLIVMIE